MNNGTSKTQEERPVIFVIDDDASLRAALEDLLETVGLNVQSFASTSEFLQAKRPDAPACLVLDVRMPAMSGLDFQDEMTKLNIEMPIVFITAHGDIPMSVRAMKGGAIEFLTKPFRDQDLLDAIHVGVDRDRRRRREAAVLDELKLCLAGLTDGEREVMAFAVSGRLNKQIAAELGVSEITVKVRRANLMRKMHARSFADLVRMADKLGLISEKK
jgi:FixJ family two-component response regulator